MEAAFIPRSERSRCGGRLAGESEALPELVAERDPPTKRQAGLLDRVREALRLRHRSPKIEKAYVGWIRRLILFNFNGQRHPSKICAPEVERFLSSLAVDGGVSASTQHQALTAILFLYRDVLGIDPPCAGQTGEV